MPDIYWTYALAIAVYLINRMPTQILHLQSPFQVLFKTKPNYHQLKIFGCLCFPWLGPYNSHKLQPKSKPCVFLGYFLTYSAYLCLDLITNRIYVSRHVQFVENQFPLSSLVAPQSSSSSIISPPWSPPVSRIPINPSQPLIYAHPPVETLSLPLRSHQSPERSPSSIEPNPGTPSSHTLPESHRDSHVSASASPLIPNVIRQRETIPQPTSSF